MSECDAEYEFPSGIKIQCQREKGHAGKHDAKWKGKQEDLYETWW